MNNLIENQMLKLLVYEPSTSHEQKKKFDIILLLLSNLYRVNLITLSSENYFKIGSNTDAMSVSYIETKKILKALQ